MSGITSYHAGLSAEDAVAQDYQRRGCTVVSRRWRGKGGEIDLIVQSGDGLIFVEVKKSRSHGRAAQSLSRHQMDRISMAASEFLGTQPRGQLTDVRFDLATVNGIGEIAILENAFQEF
ncbi:YraN family protein [Octadecabacter sp. R77987]|uniref:YraN family protein n=1 Tax=Octadecabacter sp. R77987 TaxID=3093874 RepID=UPI003672D119